MKLFALFTLLICGLAYPITSLGQDNVPLIFPPGD